MIPLSGGIRRSRKDSNPFFTGPGELIVAKNGTYTQEGGFLQHGGGTKITSSPFGGDILWMDRWYRGEGDSNPMFVLADDGAGNKELWWAIFTAGARDITFVRAESYMTGSGVDIPAFVGTYFTTAAANGWFFLKSNDVSTDLFWAARVVGSDIEFYEIGAIAPTVAPTLAVNATGTMATGVYQVAFTYLYGDDEELGESNPSPTANVNLPATDSIDVTLPAYPARTDISGVKVYVSLVGGAVTDPKYFRLKVARSAGLGPHNLDVPDSDLSFGNTELELDHDPVPDDLHSIAAAKGRLWAVQDTDARNRIKFSLIGQPYVMPASPVFFSDELNLESGSKLTTLFGWGAEIYATSEEGIWQNRGEDPSNFLWDRIPDGKGFTAERSVKSGDGFVYGLGTRDILVFDGLRTLSLTKIRGLVEETDELLLDEAVGAFRDRKYYLGLRVGASLTLNRFIMVSREPVPGASEGFAVSTIEGNYQPDLTDPASSAVFSVTTAFSSFENERERLYVARTDNNIYEFDTESSVGYNLDAEDLAGPEFELQTGWFFPAGPQSLNRFFRYWLAIENDGAGGFVKVLWEIMDDTQLSIKRGEEDIDLLEGALVGAEVGRYNQSRYS